MRSYTFTQDGVTLTVEAARFWDACGIAAELFVKLSKLARI